MTASQSLCDRYNTLKVHLILQIMESSTSWRKFQIMESSTVTLTRGEKTVRVSLDDLEVYIAI